MYKIDFPFDANLVLRKKRALRKRLLCNKNLTEKRIAILGGSTTSEVKDMLEIFLLNEGIKTVFYESEYGMYYEDSVFDNVRLKEFKPDVIYIHTTIVNVESFPSINDPLKEVDKLLNSQVTRFVEIWDAIQLDYNCPVIQNNFELPFYRVLGNLDNYDIHGQTYFINKLNLLFSVEAQKRKGLYLNDINYLSSLFGLKRWYDVHAWSAYKYAMCIEAIPSVSKSVASIIKTLYGFSKKCLVLDLDNTLWGGVIGDDGVNGIQIGRETAVSEAYLDFQVYIKALKNRGVILAVCSKNDFENAAEGFSHPDSVLKLEDFSAFKANWNPKHENILEISNELNIGTDSIVFVDDNPVEREIVRSQEPNVSVIEIGNDVTKYIGIIDKTGLFEILTLSEDDLKRSSYYSNNSVRKANEGKYSNYNDFLCSLSMKAEIKSFEGIYLDRITQLINKTNQFNLTTKRLTQSDVNEIYDNKNYIKIYGRLEDKFGDNGIVSILIGELKAEELHMDIWLMSCRVLKRGFEMAMLDQLVSQAKLKGVKRIFGYYLSSKKNSMVSDLYEKLGFNIVEKNESNSTWALNIDKKYTELNKLIIINNE